MQIYLRGLDLFVTQPERDYRAIYPVVKQTVLSAIFQELAE
jgi:hypothetical protein